MSFIALNKLLKILHTCKKLELLGLCDGEWIAGTALAKISATETCGEPNPALKP